MSRLTYTRAEWERIAQLLDDGDRVPPGLVERIDALLRSIPPGWSEEPCALELDAGSAAIIQHVSARRQVESGALGEAEGGIEDHQRDHHAATYRIEHRTTGGAAAIAYLSDIHTVQTELAAHVARLLAAGATGEVVLIEQALRAIIARRTLWPEPAGEADGSPEHPRG